jgi:hypothetical protein
VSGSPHTVEDFIAGWCACDLGRTAYQHPQPLAVSTRQLLLSPNPVTAQEQPMKAITHSRYGAPDVLELKDIDQPVVSDDDVLVRYMQLPSGRVTG